MATFAHLGCSPAPFGTYSIVGSKRCCQAWLLSLRAELGVGVWVQQLLRGG